MINLIEILRIVLKNMIEKKGRVFLTISGIVIGIFTFTFFIFVSQGLSNAITEQFSSLGANVLGVQSVSATTNGPPAGEDLTDSDVARIRQVVTDYKYVAPGIFYSAQYEYGRERSVILALAYPDEYIDEIKEDLGVEIEEGRYLRPGDSGVAVMGAKLARDGFDKEMTIGTAIETTDGHRLRIIGIMEEQGDLFLDNSMITTFDDIKEISGQDTYTIIRVSFYEGADLEANQEAIERKLNPNRNEERIRVTSSQQVIDQFNQIIGVLSMIISFISSVALLVGGINVMNTMYSNVLERINEISVMKALGATNPDIRNFFLVESGILGIVGAFIGFILAYGLAELLSFIITGLGYNVPVNFDVLLFFEVILITAFFAMLFGTYPAIRAAKVNPADNLRDE